jgi:hypothetical protein
VNRIGAPFNTTLNNSTNPHDILFRSDVEQKEMDALNISLLSIKPQYLPSKPVNGFGLPNLNTQSLSSSLSLIPTSFLPESEIVAGIPSKKTVEKLKSYLNKNFNFFGDVINDSSSNSAENENNFQCDIANPEDFFSYHDPLLALYRGLYEVWNGCDTFIPFVFIETNRIDGVLFIFFIIFCLL